MLSLVNKIALGFSRKDDEELVFGRPLRLKQRPAASNGRPNFRIA
jgi:hypothetical protein